MYCFAGNNIMEAKDTQSEENSPKSDDENATNESVKHGDGGDGTHFPEADTTQEETVANQDSIDVNSPKPDAEVANGETSVTMESGPSTSNPEVAQINDCTLTEGSSDNQNTDGQVTAENGENIPDGPGQEDATKSGNKILSVWSIYFTL